MSGTVRNRAFPCNFYLVLRSGFPKQTKLFYLVLVLCFLKQTNQSYVLFGLSIYHTKKI